MTTHSTIRNVLRALVASLFAVAFSVTWTMSAHAGSKAGHQTHDVTITKHIDKPTPQIAKKTGSSKNKGQQQYLKYELKNVYISN